jgi:hypothetical protein
MPLLKEMIYNNMRRAIYTFIGFLSSKNTKPEQWQLLEKLLLIACNLNTWAAVSGTEGQALHKFSSESCILYLQILISKDLSLVWL